MLDEKERRIVRELCKNADCTLSEVARKVGAPRSTVFDRLKRLQGHVVRKAALVDFHALNMRARAMLVLTLPVSKRQAVLDYLSTHERVNSLYRLGHDAEVLLDVAFANAEQLDDFLLGLRDMHGCESIRTHIITSEIKREAFLP